MRAARGPREDELPCDMSHGHARARERKGLHREHSGRTHRSHMRRRRGHGAILYLQDTVDVDTTFHRRLTKRNIKQHPPWFLLLLSNSVVLLPHAARGQERKKENLGPPTEPGRSRLVQGRGDAVALALDAACRRVEIHNGGSDSVASCLSTISILADCKDAEHAWAYPQQSGRYSNPRHCGCMCWRCEHFHGSLWVLSLRQTVAAMAQSRAPSSNSGPGIQ